MERSCFWARMWAISYKQTEKKKRKKFDLKKWVETKITEINVDLGIPYARQTKRPVVHHQVHMYRVEKKKKKQLFLSDHKVQYQQVYFHT